MTIECYNKECLRHSIHYDPGGGPFCDEVECIWEEIQLSTMTELHNLIYFYLDLTTA